MLTLCRFCFYTNVIMPARRPHHRFAQPGDSPFILLQQRDPELEKTDQAVIQGGA